MERFKIIILSIVILAIFSGCVSDTKPTVKNQYTDISVQQGKGMIDRQEVFILDVRTKENMQQDTSKVQHCWQSRISPEAGTCLEKLKEIPKDRKILVYCRSGQRRAKGQRDTCRKWIFPGLQYAGWDYGVDECRI